MDYRAACDTIMAIQRELRLKAREDGTLPLAETEALEASYILMEYLARCIYADER